jgi:hypothetical protein
MSSDSMVDKIKFFKITINDQPQKEHYVPVAVICFKNSTEKENVYLQVILRDKMSVKEAHAGVTFILLLIDTIFHLFDLRGRLQGTFSSTEYGVTVQVNEDSFILCKERTATWITDKGKVVKTKELTEEEYQALK